MVTLKFKIEEINGVIACHQSFENKEEASDPESSVAILIVKKVSELIPSWLSEATGCDVSVAEGTQDDMDTLIDVANSREIAKKITSIVDDTGDDWVQRLNKILEVVPVEIRDEIDSKIRRLGSTFEISKEFGPLNRVYEQDK